MIHVTELTQPLGHSTSGSQERYKSSDRLAWEKEFDCNIKMREWMLYNGICDAQQLEQIESSIKKEVRAAKNTAWNEYQKPMLELRNQLNGF